MQPESEEATKVAAADGVINFTYIRPAGFQMDSAHPAPKFVIKLFTNNKRDPESALLCCGARVPGQPGGLRGNNVLIDEDAERRARAHPRGRRRGGRPSEVAGTRPARPDTTRPGGDD